MAFKELLVLSSASQHIKAWPLAVLALALAGCASPPREAVPAAPEATRPAPERGMGDRAAHYAALMVGKPYRYGGASPSTGFDCSGLIQFSYARAGASVPRTTRAQHAASKRIARSQLRRGDLLFFHQEGKRNSHVGVYVGNGLFVHAPSSRKHVRRDRVDSPYWAKHLSEVRRLNF